MCMLDLVVGISRPRGVSRRYEGGSLSGIGIIWVGRNIVAYGLGYGVKEI